MTANPRGHYGLDSACRGFRPVACMGGMCSKRGGCPHYHAEDRREPVERLCTRGQDGDCVQGMAERLVCTRCGREGHRASQCSLPTIENNPAHATRCGAIDSQVTR